MPTAPAKLQFVTNLVTSKIFWTQVIMVAALILGASGVHVLDDQLKQAELVAGISGMMTVIFRLFSSGPVSLTAPITAPASQDIPPGASIVAVPASQDQPQVAAVVPLDSGTHCVEVAAPSVATVAAPATVIVTPAG